MKIIRNLYFSNKFYLILLLNAAGFTFGYFWEIFFLLSKILLLLFVTFLFIDFFILFIVKNPFLLRRNLPDRLSINDENKIKIYLKNNYDYTIQINIIEELPTQLQIRDHSLKAMLKPGQEKTISYFIVPKTRGEYLFGRTLAYTSSQINLIIRRFIYENKHPIVKVYPSFLKMKEYELLAISNRLQEAGIKRIRRLGHHTEFDQIREYVFGDEMKTINWRASAKKAKLMVNQFQDERSQNVINIIDMGRLMKMPFEQMALLDYAINSSLILSNIAVQKYDKAGLITFNKSIHAFLPPERKNNSVNKILEILYNQSTKYYESNYDLLYSFVKKRIPTRSLLILYTNFESFVSLERQINFLKKLSSLHLLLIVFFENTEISEITSKEPQNLKEVYLTTIAEKFIHDKKLIVKELYKHGIYSILTKPNQLTAPLINKYLEFKDLGWI